VIKMEVPSFISNVYYWIFPDKKRAKEYQHTIALLKQNQTILGNDLAVARNSQQSLEGKLKHANSQVRSLEQEVSERDQVIEEYESEPEPEPIPEVKEEHRYNQTEVYKMPDENLPARQPDLEASLDEAKSAAQYQMQRYDGIKEHGKRGDSKFVGLYSLVQYLEQFEEEVRGSIATDQFQELADQNTGVVRTAQGLSQAAQNQNGQEYVAGVAGLIAKAVDTAGVAIKAEAIKQGDYEAYRQQIPDEAMALIQQGVAGVLGTGQPGK
jgi:hypothetical protein